MRARNPMLISFCVSILYLSAACTDPAGPAHDIVQPGQLALVQTVTLSPAQATLSAGGRVAIKATPVGQNGQPMTTQIKWSSSDPKIATVSDSGDVLAVAPGKVVITAAANGAYAVAPVTVVEQAAAESVTIAPLKADVSVGKTVQFSVTSSGQAVADSVAWESSNAQVASVSSSGLVTGVSAGIASIRAAYKGQTAAATVTVLVPTPVTPPPTDTTTPPSSDTTTPPVAPSDGSGVSGLWANEPSLFTTLTDQRWNTSIASLGWQEYDPDNNVSLVSDPTVPTGDAHVLQFLYHEGFSGLGYGPGQADFPMSKGEMYLGFYWKMSPDWEGHTTNVNKMFYLFQREGSNREAVLVVCYGRPGGPYHLQISNEASDGGAWWTQNMTNTPLVPGQWYKIEMHLRKSSSDGAPDGLVEWWINGQLAARYPNAKLRGANFSEVHIDPVWGGTDPSIHKTHDDYFRFGRIHVSGR